MENNREAQEFEGRSPLMESGDADSGSVDTSGGEEEAGLQGEDGGDIAQETFPLQSGGNGGDDAGLGEGHGATSAEQFAESARTQAGAAADSLRRGEFMQNAAIDTSADSDDRLIALLCYVTQMLIPLVMPVLVLLSASSKKRPFQRFHAIQSLALSLAFILFGLFVAVGTGILALVPLIGWLIVILVACLSPVLVLMAFLALTYFGFQAYVGKRFAIPGLTSFLQDQNWI